MMNTVIRGRNQDSVKHAEAANLLGVNPKLVNQVDSGNGNQDIGRKTNHEKRDIEDPAEYETATGLSKRGREVVLLALVMHRVCRPEHGNLVAQAMIPVVAKIPENRGKNPQSNAACRPIEPTPLNIEQGEVTQHQAPDRVLHNLREIACCLTEDTGTETVDCIVATIVSSPPPPVDREFHEEREQEERHGQGDQIHVRSLT